MKRFFKALAYIGYMLLIFVFVLASPFLIFSAFLIAGSERTVYQRISSPDGWNEARVQFDDGGALSGFERLVFVKPFWNPSDTPLLSCRAFSGHGEANIELLWIDTKTLLIRHHVAPNNIAYAASRCGSTRIVTEGVLPYEKF